ncbi:MAG TPA: FkbM family methyltransferase [Burkholderiales bacterium]|nr:FkbM family methyltransferase [Burkholderiales bacterium]
MMFALPELIERYRMKITGVVHAGAHVGQEAEDYEACGIEQVLWIDANPEMMPYLNERVYPLGHVTVCACIGARNGVEVDFHFSNSADGSNFGVSSSVLPLGTHAATHPEVRYIGERKMVTQTLAALVEANWPWPGRPNFLNMDLQGYELECLKGAEPILGWFDWIYTEVNEDELYAGCALLPELSNWLAERGFGLREKRLYGAQTRDAKNQKWFGWGDAFFVRERPAR